MHIKLSYLQRPIMSLQLHIRRPIDVALLRARRFSRPTLRRAAEHQFVRSAKWEGLLGIVLRTLSVRPVDLQRFHNFCVGRSQEPK